MSIEEKTHQLKGVSFDLFLFCFVLKYISFFNFFQAI